MSKKLRAVIFVVAIVFAVAVVMMIFSAKPSENMNVEIVQDGNVIYRFDLSETENQTFTVESPDGSSSNTITIADGEIFMSDAECPDKTCVKTGVLRSESIPVVCLPNKLIIRFCEE
jgi:hypothetical protein